jgi:hypothetical protein
MRRAAFLTGLAFLALPLSVSDAQVVRWNDRGPSEWSSEAPRVRLMLDGVPGYSQGPAFAYGDPVRVRFEVDQDAYVAVGRVDADGRLTILFPTSAGARTLVRAGSETFAPGRRSGSNASFYAFDRFGTSYVFAIASSSPIDLSEFRVQDFERIGLDSRFTYANRRYAYDPDEYVQRFASWVLYDANSEYDYDVAYYTVGTGVGFASSYNLCFSGNPLFYDYNDRFGFGSYGHSLANSCRSYYNQNLWCLGYSLYGSLAGCSLGYQPYIVRLPNLPTDPSVPVERPNKKGSGFGDDWKPEKVVGDKEDWRTGEKPADDAARSVGNALRGDGEWDDIRSIPTRSRNELKRSDRDDSRMKGVTTGTTRTERRWAETERDGIRSPRATSEGSAPSREAKSVARDRDTEAPPRRFAGWTDDGRRSTDRSADNSRERIRTGGSRDGGGSHSAPPRPASREPGIRSEPTRTSPPATRTEPASTPVRSEPAKASSGGEDRRKPPR